MTIDLVHDGSTKNMVILTSEPIPTDKLPEIKKAIEAVLNATK